MSKRFLLCVLASAPASVCRADHFDDHTAAMIVKTPGAKAIKKVSSITTRQILAMPQALRGVGNAGFIVVKTDQGNWCKMLVEQVRFRSPAKQDPVEVVLLDRFVTYPADPRRAIMAQKTNTLLFGGFWFDLDIGQVVPDQAGADLRFVVGEKGSRLETAEGAVMYLIGAPMVPPSQGPRRRIGTGAVRAADFTGKYRLEADGRWSGELQLSVDKDGKVTGSYTSDKTGRTYSVTGRVGNPTNQIKFKIDLPMTVQQFEGYLWTRDRGRMTGVSYMEGLPFGFQAVRKD